MTGLVIQQIKLSPKSPILHWTFPLVVKIISVTSHSLCQVMIPHGDPPQATMYLIVYNCTLIVCFPLSLNFSHCCTLFYLGQFLLHVQVMDYLHLVLMVDNFLWTWNHIFNMKLPFVYDKQTDSLLHSMVQICCVSMEVQFTRLPQFRCLSLFGVLFVPQNKFICKMYYPLSTLGLLCLVQEYNCLESSFLVPSHHCWLCKEPNHALQQLPDQCFVLENPF